MTEPVKRMRCNRCNELRDADEIVIRVEQKRESKSVQHGPGWGVVGFPSGIHGVGPPAVGPTPAGWHTEWDECWVSYLADGTTRRYSDDGRELAWREGENVCRQCRGEALAEARRDPVAWKERREALQDARTKAIKAHRAELVGSNDVKLIARAASEMTGDIDASEAVLVWNAYLAAAQPTAPYEVVTIISGTRWKLPTEDRRTERRAVWRDAGNFVTRTGDSYSAIDKTVFDSLVKECAVPVGASLKFKRAYSTHHPKFTSWFFELATPDAFLLGPCTSAPGARLTSIISRLAREHESQGA